MKAIAPAPPCFGKAATVFGERNFVSPLPPTATKSRRVSIRSLLTPQRLSGDEWRKFRFAAPPNAALPQGVPGTVDDSSVEELDESKTVHARFELRKRCQFGEHFFLVGDEAALGLWDPSCAVPLEWSEGHVWIAELDIPIGRSIQFKFILRSLSGEINWQPGPDRVLQTWETTNTIVVSEDWDVVDEQKITEEQQHSRVIISDENQIDNVDENLWSAEGDEREPNGSETVEQPVLIPGLAPVPNSYSSGAPSESKLQDHMDSCMQEEREELPKARYDDVNDESTATCDDKQGEDEHEEPTAIHNDQKIEDNSSPAQDVVKKNIRWGREILFKFFPNLGSFDQGST